MSEPAEPDTGGTSPGSSRSGEDVAAAIRVAEEGSAVSEAHDRGTRDTTGAAPVEHRRDDPSMTEGQVVPGGGRPGSDPPPGPDPRSGSSGAAQSQQGARASDRLAAGEEPPADPSAG